MRTTKSQRLLPGKIAQSSAMTMETADITVNPIGTGGQGSGFVRHVNSDGISIAKIPLQGNSVAERTDSLLRYYGRTNYSERDRLSHKYGYKAEFLVCLAQAETGIGLQKKTPHNYFNCGNNDRGDTVTHGSLNEAMRALHVSCLDGTYLGHKTTLSHLSPNHKDSSCYQNTEDPQCQYVYASSENNRLNNLRNCLSNIHNKQIRSDYLFRLE